MKNISNLIYLLIVFFILTSPVHSQILGLDTTFQIGDYSFKTQYDKTEYGSSLKINFKNKLIFDKTFYEEITDIKEFELKKSESKFIFIEFYSGGAHCCTRLFAGKIKSNKFEFVDSLWWGNSGYEVRDIDNDGTLEIEGGNDMFAYAFTNYAETRFPPVIYRFENEHFVDVTSRYPQIIREDIAQLKKDLKEFTDKGFECLGKEDDTFNTDAGSVKTILAALVADYWTIGEVEKGYEFVKLTYKCPDRDKYIKILKDQFKLK